MADDDRRKFLKVATCALGGGVGIALAAPALRLFVAPAGETTVTSPTEPLDLGPAARFKDGAPPARVEIVAPVVKDAWSAAEHVVLGAAWIQRAGSQLVALSAVCPHLGCAVGWDAAAKNFLCPCHDSRFTASGDKLTGPSERGLDPLPLVEKDGRLQLTWVRYKLGRKKPEPA
ncbi:MAG TPA: Rieske 2Fe-2S domain-containing protein [Kofleriaceae bacterium]|jgi:Rieske Fe-S protein